MQLVQLEVHMGKNVWVNLARVVAVAPNQHDASLAEIVHASTPKSPYAVVGSVDDIAKRINTAMNL